MATSTTRFPCGSCGAELGYAPGTDVLKCSYCGFINRIKPVARVIRELDYYSAIEELADQGPMMERRTVKCETCAASFTFDPSVHADECPFCGTNIVVEPSTTQILQPQAVLPFDLAETQARDQLGRWLAKRWFAPSALKRYARQNGRLAGMYIPYWTFDTATFTRYSGARGDAYYVNRTVKTKDGTRTVRERRVRWTSVRGRVQRAFDDVLALASRSLPESYARELAPWHLGDLKPYDPAYLSGFRAESYQIVVADGFAEARRQMEARIYADVRHDIGGDEQRVSDINTQYEDVTFKQILLPVWTAAYRYGGKPYQFMVNASTGEVQGDRPYSKLKIAMAVLGAIILFILLLPVLTEGDINPVGDLFNQLGGSAF